MATISYSATWDVDTESPDDFANMTRDTTTKRTGAGSVRLNAAADVGFWTKNAVGGAQPLIVMQAYVYFTTRPTSTTNAILGAHTAGGDFGSMGYDSSVNKFFVTWSGGGTASGPTISTGVWYKLDLRIGAGGAVDGKVDGTDLTQDAGGGALSLTDYRIGPWDTPVTVDMYADDFLVSYVVGDYPITSAQTLLPDADLAAGGWATAPLYSKLNDASDATVISATAA